MVTNRLALLPLEYWTQVKILNVTEDYFHSPGKASIYSHRAVSCLEAKQNGTGFFNAVASRGIILRTEPQA